MHDCSALTIAALTAARAARDPSVCRSALRTWVKAFVGLCLMISTEAITT